MCIGSSGRLVVTEIRFYSMVFISKEGIVYLPL
jgi:hypothetical protein